MHKNRRVSFYLGINYDDYLYYYQGAAKRVRVHADNGQVVVFPANRLQPFLTHDGIHGHFEMTFDEHNKFVSLQRLKR